MEPIRPIGRPADGPPSIPAVRRLTPPEREEAARERERRRRRRARQQAPDAPTHPEPPEAGGSLDIRA